MKTKYFNRVSVACAQSLIVRLPFQMLPVSEGETQPEDIEVADIARLCVRLVGVGETGTGKPIGLEGSNRYELSGSTIIVHLTPMANKGEARVILTGCYGQVRLNAIMVLAVGSGSDTEVDFTPYVFNAIAGGAGGGMEQYVLTIKDGKFHHDDEELNFEAVKGAVMDRSKFVYLHFANAFHLPCFIVDAAGRQSVEFTSSFVIGGQAHIERVIINEQEEINVDNVQTLRINEDGGVAFGEGCEAMSEGSFAHGQSTIARGNYSHAECYETTASGDCSHAEGNNTTASGDYSHAEGDSNTASGDCSHAEGNNTTSSGDYSHAEGDSTTASGDYSHAEGWGTQTSFDDQHAQGLFNNADDFEEEDGAFMHGCGTGNNDRKNAFAISADGSIYVIGLGGYDGTNHADALSLQEIFGTNNIQASSNTLVNGYNVPSLTPEQVTQAYNAVVAGRPVTITDATGNYHLSVMQADNLSGDLAISIIYLNVMLLTYEISGGAVDIQFKNL